MDNSLDESFEPQLDVNERALKEMCSNLYGDQPGVQEQPDNDFEDANDEPEVYDEDDSPSNTFEITDAVQGDKTDQMFSESLNKSCLNLPVKRLSEGKYMFGSR